MKPSTLLIGLLCALLLAVAASLFETEARLNSILTDGCPSSYSAPISAHPQT